MQRAMLKQAQHNMDMNIQNILTLPLYQKCEKLTSYIENSTIHSLESIYPIIVADIFGIDQSSGLGWNLLKLYSNDAESKHFTAAYNFLSPGGTVFKMIYVLLNDYYIKYQFPLYYLPLDIQKSVKDGSVSQFYLDKLCIDPKTRQFIYLSLNPFECFMFHFIKYLSETKKYDDNLDISPNVDTLYQRLLAVYCDKFLPLANNLPVEPNVYYTYSGSTNLNTSAIIKSQQPKKSSLFKPGVFSQQSPNSSSFNCSLASSPGLNLNTSFPSPGAGIGVGGSPGEGSSSSLGEAWRSELLIHLFVDFWLQYDETLDLGFPKLFQPPFPQINRSNSMWMIPVFPSGYQVRCIRYVIKHFHQFSSRSLQDSSPMGELRRICLPMSQNKIYQFLRHSISHWPLDSSFKIIQETWFSFIQPWRYDLSSSLLLNRHAGAGLSSPASDNEERACESVDAYWIGFIADNFAAYSIILNLVIERLLRVDLTNLFNAHMVFRVAKVYSVPNLCCLLKQVEASIHNEKYGTIGGSFQLEKIFSYDATKKMSSLISLLDQSVRECQLKLDTLRPPNQDIPLWQFVQKEIKDMFLYHSYNKPKSYEQTRSNLQHTIRCLSQSIQWLSVMYDIPPPLPSAYSPSATDSCTSLPSRRSFSSSLSHDNTLLLDGMMDTTLADPSLPPEDSPFLPTSCLTEKFMRTRIRHLKFDGDPDTMRARSDEIEWLLDLLYKTSCRLNIMLTEQIQAIYKESSVKSFILHAILLPPQTIYYYENHVPETYSQRVAVHLPARISLRKFASYLTFVWLFVYTVLLGLLLGCGYAIALIIVFLAWFFLKLIKYQIGRMFHLVDKNK